MVALHKNKEQVLSEGFTIIDDVFTAEETDSLVLLLNQFDTSNPNFRKTNDLFAIRQFLKEIPGIQQLIFNEKLCLIIKHFFGQDYFIVKSIYFDKPEQSNWFVAYHQDLTIAVDKKNEIEGFVNWTVKQNHFAVQPPLHMLQNNFTIRIHLDDTDEKNGALKVIPGSHLKGIYRPGEKDLKNENICRVKKGGIMIMQPLLLHASGKTTNKKKRRVIHIEFSNRMLPGGLKWTEFSAIFPEYKNSVKNNYTE